MAPIEGEDKSKQSRWRIPSKAPYAWASYYAISAILTNLSKSLGDTVLTNIVSLVGVCVSIAFLIQIIANLMHLIEERPKINVDKIVSNVGLFALISIIAAAIGLL